MPTTELPPDYEELIKRLVKGHNFLRERNKLGPLTLSGRLIKAAHKHAKWMAANATLSHTGEGGSDVGARTRAEGYPWACVRENIAEGQTMAGQVLTAWMQSTGHYANILATDINDIGPACVVSVNNDVRTRYWCTVFGRKH